MNYRDLQLLNAIRNDGKGFDNTAVHHRSGLKNMRQRAREMQGECNISSLPGKSVLVEVSFTIATFSYT